jgi:hypothetical protein
MRKYSERAFDVARNTFAAIGVAAFVAALAAIVLVPMAPIAKAQVQNKTNTTQVRLPVPRQFATEQVHYIRSTLTFNMCTQASNACTVRLMNASLPYNAIVARVNVYVYTAFNSTTSDTITLGTTSANANEIVSSAVSIHAQGTPAATVVATAFNSTGNTVAQSGANGGLDLWVTWTAGTGNTATAGLVSLVIEYFAPNDGLCTPNIPLGSVPAGC